MQNAFTADNKLTARAANQPVSLALAVRRSSSSRITGRGGGGRRWGKKKYIYINKSINRRVPLFFLWGGITWGGGTSSDFIHILRKWHGTRYKQQNNNDPRPVISFFFFRGRGRGGGKGTENPVVTYCPFDGWWPVRLPSTGNEGGARGGGTSGM